MRDIGTPDGNQSDMPKKYFRTLRPAGWLEVRIQRARLVRMQEYDEEFLPNGKTYKNARSKSTPRMIENVIDGHKEVVPQLTKTGAPERFKSGKNSPNPKTVHATYRASIMWMGKEHSRKPDEFDDRVESCRPRPYLALFARGPCENWSGWSNQSDDDDPGWLTYSNHSPSERASIGTRHGLTVINRAPSGEPRPIDSEAFYAAYPCQK